MRACIPLLLPALLAACSGPRPADGTGGPLRICSQRFDRDHDTLFLSIEHHAVQDTARVMVKGRAIRSMAIGPGDQHSIFLVGLNGTEWNSRFLTVQFLDGDSVTQRRVRETAGKWEQVCGIRFKFDQASPLPDIRISFKEQGSWSYVGKDSRKHCPSMNLGWLRPGTDQAEYDRVVLHEFGHAMGFIHEHQSPNAQHAVHWNRKAVVRYYRDTLGWPEQDIEDFVFRRYRKAETNVLSEFDPLSIMIYAISPYHTTDGYGVAWNTKLSADDITLARALYPMPRPDPALEDAAAISATGSAPLAQNIR
ncbi:MAG: hypothetical protein H6595_09955 [Flavobacteriales bacterium]|nr:hypothetical protein [Flavobacteriales bacterium]